LKKASFLQRAFAAAIDTLLFVSLGFAFRNGFFDLGSIIYETVLISQWNGQTIGKKVVGIRVVREAGEQVDILHAFIRSISKVLSFAVLLLGYLWMLWDGKSQTWHDKLAETYVVEG